MGLRGASVVAFSESATRLRPAEADLEGGKDVSAKVPPKGWRLHELKTWPRYYRELVTDRKHSEHRRFDRDFRIGDVLRLREWDPAKKEYTGREMFRCIRYLYTPHEAPGFVVLELMEEEP